MKNRFFSPFLTFILSLGLILPPPLWAEDPPGMPLETFETDESGEPYESPVVFEEAPESQAEEPDWVPDSQEVLAAVFMRGADGRETIALRKGKILYHLEPPNLDETARKKYLALSEMEKMKFHTTRRWILASVGRFMNLSRLGFYAYALIKDRIWKKSVPKDLSASDAQIPTEKLTFRVRGHDVIAGLLGSINSFLWNRAPVIAASNERGFSLGIGIQGVLAAGLNKETPQENATWGQRLRQAVGRGLGFTGYFGLQISYNRSKKSIVIVPYVSRERFLGGAIANAGFLVKAGFFSIRRDDSNQSGVSWTPPLPFLYAEESSNYVEAGFFTSLVGVPGEALWFLGQAASVRKKAITVMDREMVQSKKDYLKGLVLGAWRKAKEFVLGCEDILEGASLSENPSAL